MGGYRIPEESKSFLISIYDSMKEHDKKPSAQKVLNAANAYLTTHKRNDIYLPKIRKVQYLISDAEKRREDLPDSEQKQQKPWSMAALNELELSPESIPHVLQVWRYSVNLGAEFTIRQAKWTSRLYAQVPDITELWLQSRRYSREEELSLLTGEPMKIYMLDGRLVMGDWEFDTTLGTDVLKPDIIRYIHHTFKPLASDGGIAEELLHSIPMSSLWEPQEESLFERESKLHRLIADLPASTNYFPDIESRMVYLRHLSYLSKGPKWNTLPPKEILNTIIELRKWVIDTKAKIDETKSVKNFHDFLNQLVTRQQSYPLHLYDRAGYNFLNKGGSK